MRLADNFFYANGVDASAGLMPYAVVGGELIGLDNNYRYAVYPDGHVEFAFQNPNGSEYRDIRRGAIDPQIVSATELRALGVDISRAPRDAHGVPQPAGYPALNNVKNGPGGLGDALGAIAFTVLSAGFGYAALTGIAVDVAGAAEAVGGATAAGVTLAPEVATVAPVGLVAEGGAVTATGLADVAVTVPELSAADLAAISTGAGGGAATTAASIGTTISTAAGKIATAVATSAVAGKVRDALGLGPSAPQQAAPAQPAPAPAAPGDAQLGALAALAIGFLLVRAIA